MERLRISTKEAQRIANETWGGVYLVRRVQGGFEVLLHSATGPRYLLDDFGIEVKSIYNSNPVVRGRDRTLYFPSYAAARAFARKHKHPVDRIIHYGKGWAIQGWKSGPYVTGKQALIADRYKNPRRRRGSRTKGTTPFQVQAGRGVTLDGNVMFNVSIPFNEVAGYTGLSPSEADGMTHYIQSLLNEAGGVESFNEFMAYYMRH